MRHGRGVAAVGSRHMAGRPAANCGNDRELLHDFGRIIVQPMVVDEMAGDQVGVFRADAERSSGHGMLSPNGHPFASLNR
jgi:hypothetical protein